MKFKLEGFLKKHNKGCKCNFRKTITDHLGNVFSSIRRMLEFYKINPGRYYYFKSRYTYLKPAEILQKILDKQKEKDNGKKAPTHT